MDTKEAILNAALDLFSVKGYTASSVRDICGAVGIKESSLYYHFENKQAILSMLQNRFCERAEAFMACLDKGLLSVKEMGREGFITISKRFFESYLMDGFANKFIRIMMIEQTGNAQMREMYHKWCFEMPVEFQARIFEQLVGIGFLKPMDCRFLAVSYYAPIFFYFNRYLACGDMDEDRKRLFLRAAHGHIGQYLDEKEAG